jgi:hypothetical protein
MDGWTRCRPVGRLFSSACDLIGRRESWELLGGSRCMCGNAKPQNRASESHDMLVNASSAENSAWLCLSHMPMPREAVRLEAVRLNGIDQVGSVGS